MSSIQEQVTALYTPSQHAAINKITAREHAKHHDLDTCGDIHPVVHAEQLAGWRRKAIFIVTGERAAG